MAEKNVEGKLITFEGSEGCGKSTQSKLLAEYLSSKGHSIVYLREPGGTKISEKIREILLDARNKKILPVCETLLYMAARAQLVSEVILPALKQEKIVICDRFLDSTIAYQGCGLGIDIPVIQYIGRFANNGIKPCLTIFLDIEVKKGLKYRRGSKDRIERRPLDYHYRVRKGYLELAKYEPRRIKIVRLDEDQNKTQAKIRKLVECYLKI